MIQLRTGSCIMLGSLLAGFESTATDDLNSKQMLQRASRAGFGRSRQSLQSAKAMTSTYFDYAIQAITGGSRCHISSAELVYSVWDFTVDTV